MIVRNVSAVSWINRYLKIIDKDSQLVPLYPNIGQLMLQNTIELQTTRNLPVRIILLKPRQVGWSTWCQALGFEYANMNPNVTVQAVSADMDATDHIFRMARLFQSKMPDDVRLPLKHSSRKELVFAEPHRSRIITQTAGKDALGIGTTVKFFHGSEVSKWPNDTKGLSAAFQQVPNKPDTYIILESTANGMSGVFYEMFWEAVERRRDNPDDYNGYLPVFFPWHKFSEYSVITRKLDLDEKEEELKKVFNLTDGQLMWRRLKLQELRGDEASFCEQYPLTAQEAFQSSGNPVFNITLLDFQSRKINREIKYGLFIKDQAGRIRLDPVNRTLNCWQIATFPEEGHQYTMGIDTMEGRISDARDNRSALDYHGVSIFDRNALRFSCIYKGRGNQQELGNQCLLAGEFYNNAFVGPEVPSGIIVLNIFKNAGYENIYNRQIHDEQYVEEDSDCLGWRTTQITRKWLVEQMLVSLQEDPPIFIIFDDILSEMRTFVRNREGKPIHASGKHDDLLFSAMIALQLHLRCPMESTAYGFQSTGIYSFNERTKSLSEIGVVDSGCEDEYYEESGLILERTI